MSNDNPCLWVFLHDVMVGRIVPLRRGGIHLYYESAIPGSLPPLSLSLPVGPLERHDVSEWINGILPENPRTRTRWARELGAASTAPYDLLCSQAGLECGGAVQFCPQTALPHGTTGVLLPLSESDLAESLRLISRDVEGDPAAGLGRLRLSLAGAQAKMALRFTPDGWCLPTGPLATTHILKPQKGHLSTALRDSIAVNEHLCQTAAASLGLDAANTWLESFHGEQCLIVERFDRSTHGESVSRLHAEDFCQALGVPAGMKYQDEGGPSPETILSLLKDEGQEGDTNKFFLALYYNWLIGNPDGHAKNYSLLLQGQTIRLAPLYDLSSLAPYVPPGDEALTPAMDFNGFIPATLGEWQEAAKRADVDVSTSDLRDMAEALPQAFRDAAAQCPDWASETAERMCDEIVAHASRMAPPAATGTAGSFWMVDTDALPPAAPTFTTVARCGKNVTSTDKPCLLRKAHRGHCRSVL